MQKVTLYVHGFCNLLVSTLDRVFLKKRELSFIQKFSESRVTLPSHNCGYISQVSFELMYLG